jgi:phosphoglycolate phosphatase
VIENLIFDLDGTLVDSCGICIEILSSMLADRGSDHAIDPMTARPLMSVGGEAMVAALMGPACTDPTAELAEFRRRYASWRTPMESLFPHVSTGIAALDLVGYRMAICSNKPQYLCDKVLDDTGLERYFAAIVGSRDGIAKKPAPDLLHKVLGELNADPQQCLFIGDSEVDCATAAAAGMPFLYMTYGYAEPGWLPETQYSFDSFGDLTATLLPLDRRYDRRLDRRRAVAR